MEQFVRQTLARAVEVGNRRAQALCYHALGAVQYLTGQWREAGAALERSIPLARSVDSVFGEVLGLQRLGLLETGLGQYARAEERLQQALALARKSRSPMVRGHGIGRVLATLALNRLQAGDLERATAHLARGFAMQRQVGECPSCDVLLYPAAVPIYVTLGDLEQAEVGCRKAEEAATAFRSQAWTASARYLRGLLAMARGEWIAAAGALEGALDLFDSLGQPYDAAQCLAAFADLATRAGPALSNLSPEELRQRVQTIHVQLGITGGAQPAKRA